MRTTRLFSLALGALALAALAFGCAPADTADDADTAATDTMAAADEYTGAVAADPDHYSVAYENDAVRLLRVEYGAGESSVMHSHPAHCGVVLDDATFRMTPAEGEPSDVSFAMGEVVCVEAGAHMPHNTGDATARVVLVEFKPGATAGSDSLPDHPGAVTADPDHYSVEFENDVARLVRIAYGPGETSVMHMHPANCAIFLTDQPTRMELPSGDVEEQESNPTGYVECGDAGAHLPTNAGDGDLELILVELKGRATWNGAM